MTIRIKERMQEKGITSVVLSGKIGVSKVSISYIINGKQKPSFDTLEKIADALDVPMWQLFVDPDKIGDNKHNLGSGFVCPNCGARLTVSKEEEK